MSSVGSSTSQRGQVAQMSIASKCGGGLGGRSTDCHGIWLGMINPSALCLAGYRQALHTTAGVDLVCRCRSGQQCRLCIMFRSAVSSPPNLSSALESLMLDFKCVRIFERTRILATSKPAARAGNCMTGSGNSSNHILASLDKR